VLYFVHLMRPIEKLKNTLEEIAGKDHYLFAVGDFYQLFPKMSNTALNVLISRAARKGILERVCKGLYIYPKADYDKGFELYHCAARLRENVFCYLSLESVLSEAGVISQIPLGTITLMTSGRSGIIDCGRFGKIEFIHTQKSISSIVSQLRYNERYKLWTADAALALKDLRYVGRNTDLIDWSAANELI